MNVGDNPKIQDDQALMRSLQEAADRGDAESAYRLGQMFDWNVSRGAALDYVAAADWYRKAADLGHADAQLLLGLAYRHGTGVERDEVEAARWCRKAAEQGCARAQFVLGSTYRKGVGTDVDGNEAVRWYEMAAAQGDELALLQLAEMYESGDGVVADPSAALKWYRLAAELRTVSVRCIPSPAFMRMAAVCRNRTRRPHNGTAELQNENVAAVERQQRAPIDSQKCTKKGWASNRVTLKQSGGTAERPRDDGRLRRGFSATSTPWANWRGRMRDRGSGGFAQLSNKVTRGRRKNLATFAPQTSWQSSVVRTLSPGCAKPLSEGTPKRSMNSARCRNRAEV